MILNFHLEFIYLSKPTFRSVQKYNVIFSKTMLEKRVKEARISISLSNPPKFSLLSQHTFLRCKFSHTFFEASSLLHVIQKFKFFFHHKSIITLNIIRIPNLFNKRKELFMLTPSTEKLERFRTPIHIIGIDYMDL